MQQVTTPPVRLPVAPALDDVAPVERRRTVGRGVAGEAEESYRKAALSLSKMVAGGARSVLFCSARRREGTTTAVLSLAHQLQDNYGLRPLVIELSRRRPALTRLFALDPDRSLDAALDRSQSLTDCVQVTPSGLSVIPGGVRRAATPHPRLASGLSAVLREAEDRFDVVLVDAPPALAQTDAIIVATVVRTLILIVEAGRSSYEVLERVRGELANEDVTIAGTLLVKHKRFIPRWIYWWLTR